MGARELLADLAGAGFTIETDGDRLLVRPASKLTHELRARLRQVKPELLALLRDDDDTPHQYAPAREAMHRLGYRDDDAEAQLAAVLQTVPAATVIADLQAIGDDRGLSPTVDPVEEMYAERLQRRGLSAALIASLAPRLAQRDRDRDDRRSCVECARFNRIGASRGQVAWFCQHPSTMVKHGCHGPDLLFRCEGFLGCR